MTPTTKGLLLGGVAIALGALAVAMLPDTSDTSDHAPAGAAPRARPVQTTTRASEPRALADRRWISGTTYVYEIDSAHAMLVRSDRGPQENKALGLAGRLSISVVGPSEEGIVLRFVFDEIRPGAAGAALPIDTGRLTSAFHAVAEPTGKLASFAFRRGVDGTARTLLKSLATALQLVVPDPTATAWRTLEQDGSSEYEAAYRATGDAIHKTKERLVRMRQPRGLVALKDPSAVHLASSIEFALDASGWPRTMSGDETLTMTAGPLRIEAKGTTRARLLSIDQAPDLAAIAEAERETLEPEPEIDLEAFATAKRRADEGLVDGASYDALLVDLASADARVRNRTMARIAALVRLQPQEAARATASILAGKLEGQTTKRLIGALGGAGTPEAQQALTSLLDRDAPAETRGDAAAALGLTKNPTDDSQRSLARAAGSSDPVVASAATLGLGNLVKRMNEHGTGDPSDAVALLVRRLHGASDDAERILCLDALGNTGDPRALPAIEPYLAHADPRVRAAAVEALRFLAAVDDKLAAALGDPAAVVRRAAAGALAYRAITPLLPLVTLLVQHDPDVPTRLELVTALQLRKRQEPALEALLAWAAEHDPAAEVRRAARGHAGS